MSKTMTKPIIQISLDVPTINDALAMAEIAVRAGVDWLEAGTPLIMGEGVHGVRALRAAHPNHPIIADIKCMDGSGLETTMMLEAGATFVVVMGQAHDGSIIEAAKACQQFKTAHPGQRAELMVDVMVCSDKPARARQAQALGADIIVVHTGHDERRHHSGLSPIHDLPGILEAVTIPVQAVGGLSVEQALQTLEMGAQMVVFGAPLLFGKVDFRKDPVGFEAMVRVMVARVKKA